MFTAVSERLACKGLPLTIPVTPPPGVPRHPPLGGSKMPATLRTVPFQHRHGYKEKKLHDVHETLCIKPARAQYTNTESVLDGVVQLSEPTAISDVSQQTSN